MTTARRSARRVQRRSGRTRRAIHPARAPGRRLGPRRPPPYYGARRARVSTGGASRCLIYGSSRGCRPVRGAGTGVSWRGVGRMGRSSGARICRSACTRSGGRRGRGGQGGSLNSARIVPHVLIFDRQRRKEPNGMIRLLGTHRDGAILTRLESQAIPSY